MHFKEQVNISFFMAQVIPALSREDANNCKGPGGFLPADPEERNREYLLCDNWSHSQAYVYSRVSYDPKKLPDSHGTFLTKKHVLAKGAWHMGKILSKILFVVKVKSF